MQSIVTALHFNKTKYNFTNILTEFLKYCQAAQWEAGTALGALRGLSSQVRAARARGGADSSRRRALAATLRALVERTHDFTDSAYTSHEHRQRILMLAERIAYELERLVAVAVSLVRTFSIQLDLFL